MPHKMWDIDPDESLDFKILKVGGCMKLSTGKGEEKRQQSRQPPFLPFWGKRYLIFFSLWFKWRGVMRHIERTMLRKAPSVQGTFFGNQSWEKEVIRDHPGRVSCMTGNIWVRGLHRRVWKGNQSWIFIGRTDAEAKAPNTLAIWCEELTH